MSLSRRERMMKTLRGEAVDRPAFNFYELNGLTEKLDDRDPFNIYNHPSWRPLIEMTAAMTDRIVMQGVPFKDMPPDPLAELTERKSWTEGKTRTHEMTLKLPGNRTLTTRAQRDAEVNTWWTTEHLLKDEADLKAYLQLPPPVFGGVPIPDDVLRNEAKLGETGIVMIDTADPLCYAADLFDMGQFTVIALTEPDLFRRLLDRFAATLLPQTEAIAKVLPGRLWRIFGPEFAAPPYLPPALFEDYAVRYVRPMVESIHRTGGFARIHCHGRLRAILDLIQSTGCAGLDPIEPPHQGDVTLAYVREKYGRYMVLFGNLEASDIENLPTTEFARKVNLALDEGTAGQGRGFVLQPSACPYGRVLSDLALRNYQEIVRIMQDRYPGALV